MIPIARIDERDPHARGAAIGAAWRERIAAGWAGYERLFAAAGAGQEQQREVAERSLERTQAWAPALADEIAGIAAGTGLDTWRVARSTPGPRCWRRRARRPPANARRSSSPLPAASSRTIQTWDWYEHLHDNFLLLTLTTGDGGAVHLFTEFGIVGKIGVNDAGLGLHFTSSIT